jgi:hypothetical protein
MKLQGSGPSAPKSLQSQNHPRPENRLSISRLDVVHGQPDTSLPPAGTVLSAKIMLPVWSEPQAGANDQSKLQSRLPSGACVRVVSTRGGSGRLWAEVAPASCS